MADQTRSRQQRKNNTVKKKKKKNGMKIVFRTVFLTLFFLGLIGMIGGSLLAYSYIKDTPPLDLSLLKDPLSSKIYDKDGNMIADLGVEKRTEITYNEIPETVRNAFIAVEDVRFSEHIGVDFKRIIGAALANVTDGFGAEGASTITQQVVKNYFLSPEKSIERKVQEAWLAIQLEQKLSKSQILELYLNKIYFSKSAYGVAKAAETYYGKKLEDLEIHEAALLAGMPQAPNRYNPFAHPEAAEKRRNIVISLMEKHGFITKAEAEEAKSIPVQASLVQNEEKDSTPYDAFLDQVIEEVQSLGDFDVYSAGLKIYTTLDPNAQSFVENVLDTDEYVQYPNDEFQAGIVLLDTNTGEIRAIGGGRNRKVARGLSFATDINPQPGSTIKPILDYGPAIEYLKWSTYHQIVDDNHTYSDGTPIKNWDNEHWGQMSIRTALEWSRNIPALKTIQTVGLDRAREFGTTLGLNLDEQIFESHSIGGFNGVSPMELAGAYSAFGNNGIYNKPHTVKRVVFPDERVIELSPSPVVAMSDYTAFMVTDMLKSVVRTGTGKSANVSGVPIAGKTGTTNFDDETKQKYNIKPGGVPDIWFAGYSPSYTMAVWTGYSKTTEENYIIGDQKNIAKNLFKVIMKEVHKDQDTPNFSQPNSVVKVGIEKGSMPAKLPSEFTPEEDIIYEYFVKGKEPTEVSEQFQKVEAPFDIMPEYEEVLDRILIRWDYNQEKVQGVSFLINQSINGEPFTELIRTKENFITINNPEKGAQYQFELIAVSDTNEENRSEPILLTVNVPEEESPLNPFPTPSEENEDGADVGSPENDSSNPEEDNPLDSILPGDEGNQNDQPNEAPSDN